MLSYFISNLKKNSAYQALSRKNMNIPRVPGAPRQYQHALICCVVYCDDRSLHEQKGPQITMGAP